MRPRQPVHLAEQRHLCAEIRFDRREGEVVEVVGPRARMDGDRPGLRGMLGDRLRLTRGDFEVPDVQVVGVRVSRAHTRLRPDPAALADRPRRLLDDPVLDDQLLGHLVLDEHVGVVHLTRGRPHEGVQPRLGETVAVSEEEVRPRRCRHCH
jgi:hypothetical protein